MTPMAKPLIPKLHPHQHLRRVQMIGLHMVTSCSLKLQSLCSRMPRCHLVTLTGSVISGHTHYTLAQTKRVMCPHSLTIKICTTPSTPHNLGMFCGKVSSSSIGKDMGNPWVSNSQPIPIPTSNPYPRPVGTCFRGLTHGFQVICMVAMQIIYMCTTRQQHPIHQGTLHLMNTSAHIHT